MESDEFDDLLGPDSDGAAYQKVETRKGPPLDYIAEKMMESLEMLHSGIRSFKQHSGEQTDALRSLEGAFRMQLTAFLGLINMLVLADSPSIVSELLERNSESFSAWLANVKGNGSVLGLPDTDDGES